MSLINLIDSRINRILPAKHKSVLYILFFFLVVIFLLPEAQQEIPDTQRPLAANAITQSANSKFQELISAVSADADDPIDSRLFLEVQPGDNLTILFKR